MLRLQIGSAPRPTLTKDAVSYQISPRLLLVILRLKLVNLEKALKPILSWLTRGGDSQNGVPHVKHPVSVTSINSINSSFVSSEKGVPLVSVAHASRPSLDKDAPSTGVRKMPRFPFGLSGGWGVQYFAKMCLRHRSN